MEDPVGGFGKGMASAARSTAELEANNTRYEGRSWGVKLPVCFNPTELQCTKIR
jgi:hypothetical protein